MEYGPNMVDIDTLCILCLNCYIQMQMQLTNTGELVDGDKKFTYTRFYKCDCCGAQIELMQHGA